LANLLGYKTWASYVTEDKMIGSAENAHIFIDRINSLAKPRAEKDYKQLLTRLQQEDPKATQVGDWQKSYISGLVRKEQYDLDNNVVRQYFSYHKVRDGIFAITGKMFDLRYEKVDTPTWHKSVEAYQLIDNKTDKKIASFFLDMHPRDNKYKHAAAFPLITGVSNRQQPQASLVCNFPEDGPMEHAQVETFFHEFGHLLHHMLGGNHRWLGVSGFNTEWDFVEAPSQMLEEWALDYNTLKIFASNDKGEVIPESLVKSMKRAAEFGKGTDTRHQMFYAAMSLNFYDTDPAKLDTTATMKALQQTYSPFPYVDNTYMQTSFGHLDGYSAIYYTYMWSKVIAKDLFSVFAKEGLLNTDVASRYRKYILAQGGSKNAAVMVKEFLGRDYTFDSFSNWLNAN